MPPLRMSNLNKQCTKNNELSAHRHTAINTYMAIHTYTKVFDAFCVNATKKANRLY